MPDIQIVNKDVVYVDDDKNQTIIADENIVFNTRVAEVLNTITNATGNVEHDFSKAAVFYHSNITASFVANFTNVPTTNDRSISIVLILNQGADAYVPTAVQIDGSTQTVKYQGGNAPEGSADSIDVISFTLIRSSSAWNVIGSSASYS